MRLIKVLLMASLFGTGAALAQDVTEQKPEQVPAEQDQLAALEEAEVIDVHPG